MKKYFDDYGYLNSITLDQYYSEPWSPIDVATDRNGNEWDIVRNARTCETAYTTI